MSKPVIIAEKPSLARAISQGLGEGQSKKGYIDTPQAIVTWVAGHFLELYEPHDYDPAYKKWRMEHLPILPEHWEKKPVQGSEEQLKIISQLLRKTDEAVNCGDAGREGQLLIDEVLEYLGFKGKVTRMWVNSVNPDPLREAFEQRRNNQAFQPLKEAAEARSRADWAIGMNLTRALTLTAQNQGYDGVLSVGRVQTPTAALVYARDMQIEHFKPHDYYLPTVHARHANGSMQATWVPGEGVSEDAFDEQGRLVDEQLARSVLQAVEQGEGAVTSFEAKTSKNQPPLPFDLGALQSEANKRLKMGVKETLKRAQELYDAGVITYPRTDCRHYEEADHANASSMLGFLAGLGVQGSESADPALRSKAWNDKKVAETDHTALAPTGKAPQDPSDRVFQLIAEQYVKQFHPPEQKEQRTAWIDIDGYAFKAQGTITLEPGWRGVFGNAKAQDEKENPVPKVAKQDAVQVESTELATKKTTPPDRFTEGTLREAMSNIHRHIAKDHPYRDLLRDNDGIGRPATQADIIETLFKRGVITKGKGGTIQTSDLGREQIRQMPEALTDPAMTALWERVLGEIAKGNHQPADFLEDVQGQIGSLMEVIRQATFSTQVVGERHYCDTCGEPLRRVYSKKTRKRFWVCTNEECQTPPRPDENGKPGMPIQRAEPDPNAPCPVCGEPMVRRESRKKAGFFFWACPADRSHPLCHDENGKPGEKIEFSDRKSNSGGGKNQRTKGSKRNGSKSRSQKSARSEKRK